MTDTDRLDAILERFGDRWVAQEIHWLMNKLRDAEKLSERLQRENARLARVYEYAAHVSQPLSETWRDDTVEVTLPARTWREFQRVMGGGA